MCGRYGLDLVGTTLAERLAAQLGISADASVESWAPDYNIAPSRQIPVVAGDTLTLSRWGVPSKDGFKEIPNARDDRIQTAPMWSYGFHRGRSVVPMTGWYEWEKGLREPWRFHRHDNLLMFAASISWVHEGKHTTVIATCDPNETCAKVHNRMPALLEPDEVIRWLDMSTPGDEARSLLRPAPDAVITRYRIRRGPIGKDNRHDAEVIKPAQQTQPGLFD